MSINVVFFGSDSFAKLVLEKLLEKKFKLSGIVTKEGSSKGPSRRSTVTCVKKFLIESGVQVPHFCPEKASSPEFIQVLNQFNPDIFIVCGYGEIIKKDLLDMPKIVCINIHPSKLPLYRGATPIQSALVHGDSSTAVSIMQMVLKMDAGPIYEQIPVEIDLDDNYESLEAKLTRLCVEPLITIVQKFASGIPVCKTDQDEDKVTFCKRIFVEDCQIDWLKEGLEIHNLIRACSTRPGAWTSVKVQGQVKKCKILKAQLSQDSQNVAPGTILEFSTRGGWHVQCKMQALEILLVQLEGKRIMPAKDFINGIDSLAFTK